MKNGTGILGFIVTEKSSAQAPEGKYSFWVDYRLSKSQIKSEIEERFKVEVIKTNIINLKGKKKSLRQQKGKRSDQKKAIVTIKKGQRIKEFEITE
jgi:large subunit ribosomal protein L23